MNMMLATISHGTDAMPPYKHPLYLPFANSFTISDIKSQDRLTLSLLISEAVAFECALLARSPCKR